MPVFFKYVLKYVTPTMLIIIFLSALVKPKNDDWSKISLSGWELDNTSIIAELTHQNIGPNGDWFADEFFAENSGTVTNVCNSSVSVGERTYAIQSGCVPTVTIGEKISAGDTIYKGNVINNVFYIDAARILLLLIIAALCIMIAKANKRPHYID